MTERESKLIKVFILVFTLAAAVLLTQVIVQNITTKLDHLKTLRTQLVQWQDRKKSFPPSGDLTVLKQSVEQYQLEVDQIKVLKEQIDKSGSDPSQTLKTELNKAGFTIKSITLSDNNEVEFIAIGTPSGLAGYLEKIKTMQGVGGVRAMTLQNDTKQGVMQLQVRITYD